MITRMNILPHADAGIITKLLRKNRRAASPAVRRSEKAWGMAGLRLGLAFASEAVAGLFARVKYPYNINSLAQQAVAERLTEDIAPQVAEIRAERDRLAPQLAACPAIGRVYPSDANFILVRTPDPDRMYDALISAGVIVRNRSRIPGCEGCLRITVGTPAENARMIETVKNFRL